MEAHCAMSEQDRDMQELIGRIVTATGLPEDKAT
jgi:hypothetical protein